MIAIVNVQNAPAKNNKKKSKKGGFYEITNRNNTLPSNSMGKKLR